MFDKSRCISNIYQLAKDRCVKIGDLEKSSGVSVGYLSRINKEDSTTIPTIDFIADVAGMLGVTVDSLLNNDFCSPTPTEKYILSFIDRLLSQTNANKLDWKKETVAQLHSVGIDYNNEPDHALYTIESDNNGLKTAYDSKFNPGVDVSNDCFNLSLPGTANTVVYLMCVNDPAMMDLPFSDNTYELYIVQGWSVKPLCHSSPANSPFSKSLQTLYSAVTEYCKHPKLESEVMSAIDAFMGISAAISSDEELPF